MSNICKTVSLRTRKIKDGHTCCPIILTIILAIVMRAR